MNLALILLAALQQHSECWLDYQGILNGGSNPTQAELKAEIVAQSQAQNVPYEIICAVMHVESAMKHFHADGKLLHNVPECKNDYKKYVLGENVSSPNPPGLGLMQLTGSTAQAYDVDLLRTSWQYNLYAGVSVLVGKYNTYRAWLPAWLKPLLDANRHLLENWYMVCWFYNGFTSSNSQVPNTYLNKLWNLPNPLPQYLDGPVWVTRAPDVLGAHFGYNAAGKGNQNATDPDFKFVAQADGVWICAHGTEYAGAVNPTTAVPPAAPANLAAIADCDQIAFAWEGAADGFWLDLATDPNGPWESVYVEDVQYTWPALAAETTYYWRVTAVNQWGSTVTDGDPATTPACPIPEPPAGPEPEPEPEPDPSPAPGGGGGGSSGCSAAAPAASPYGLILILGLFLNFAVRFRPSPR